MEGKKKNMEKLPRGGESSGGKKKSMTTEKTKRKKKRMDVFSGDSKL